METAYTKKEWTYLKANKKICYATVNLNIFEVGYLHFVWEIFNPKNEFELVNKDVPNNLQNPQSHKKAFVSVSDKGSAEVFMSWVTDCDKTYHTDKDFYLQQYDENKKRFEVA